MVLTGNGISEAMPNTFNEASNLRNFPNITLGDQVEELENISDREVARQFRELIADSWVRERDDCAVAGPTINFIEADIIKLQEELKTIKDTVSQLKEEIEILKEQVRLLLDT